MARAKTKSSLRPSRPVPEDTAILRRTISAELIADARHYTGVMREALLQARVSVWIATANLKDVHVEAPRGTRAFASGKYLSISECFADLVQKGVEIRLLHAAPASARFAAALARTPALKPPGFERRVCPRVHLKLIVVDGAYLYLGSANFTGAGLGAKHAGRRNFELGIATDDDLLTDAAQLRFDKIWTGQECGSCRLRNHCPQPLDGKGQHLAASNRRVVRREVRK